MPASSPMRMRGRSMPTAASFPGSMPQATTWPASWAATIPAPGSRSAPRSPSATSQAGILPKTRQRGTRREHHGGHPFPAGAQHGHLRERRHAAGRRRISGDTRGFMSRDSRGIQSIEVGGELLRALARSGEPMMLRDLAREAGMAPAKAHPYLVSFSRIGLIEQDETTGRYEIGALALELGLISLRRLSGVRIAQPKIAGLASQIGHAVSLAVWGTHGPTVVRLEEPSHPVHIAMGAGSTMALLETATGPAFAAFLAPH